MCECDCVRGVCVCNHFNTRNATEFQGVTENNKNIIEESGQ